MSSEPGKLFRAEALREQATTHDFGEVLRLSPRWMRPASWALVGLLILAALFSLLGKVDTYVAGPAVVRVEGRREVTASAGGNLAEILVHPGDHVVKGEALLRLDDLAERDQLASATQEFELELLRRLDDPGGAPSPALSQLRARRDLAAAQLQGRIIRSPIAGVVGDLRLRSGERLNPGEQAATVVQESARYSVTAWLPGESRPFLHRGLPLRLELKGFPYAHIEASIDALGDEVVGPVEARRYLGQNGSDIVPLSGAVVFVHATLETEHFLADGRKQSFFDGMQATAEASLHQERILFSLIPSLRLLADASP